MSIGNIQLFTRLFHVPRNEYRLKRVSVLIPWQHEPTACEKIVVWKTIDSKVVSKHDTDSGKQTRLYSQEETTLKLARWTDLCILLTESVRLCIWSLYLVYCLSIDIIQYLRYTRVREVLPVLQNCRYWPVSVPDDGRRESHGNVANSFNIDIADGTRRFGCIRSKALIHTHSWIILQFITAQILRF